MVHKLGLILLLAASQLTLAEPLTTPHTFTAGTPALASQVNENFQAHETAINAKAPSIKIKSSNVVIGDVTTGLTIAGDNSLTFISSKRYVVGGNLDIGRTAPLVSRFMLSSIFSIRYATTDCTGQPYAVIQGSPIMLFSAPVVFTIPKALNPVNATNPSLVYYTNPASLTTIVPRSSYENVSGTWVCWPYTDTAISAYTFTPNNPSVTGVQFQIESIGLPQNDDNNVFIDAISLQIQ